MVIIRYNILSAIKRSEDYETIGGLFVNIYEGVHKLTVVEKIWQVIPEVVAIIDEMMSIDEEELIEKIIEDSRRLEAMQLMAQTA